MSKQRNIVWPILFVVVMLLGAFAFVTGRSRNRLPQTKEKRLSISDSTFSPLSLTPLRTNVALLSNGGMASASTTYTPSQGTGYDANPPNANNGDRTGKVGNTLVTWTDNTHNSWSDWLQIEFNGSKTIDEIDVYTFQDNLSNPIEPTEATTFTTYGLTAFEVQYWNGSNWSTITLPCTCSPR